MLIDVGYRNIRLIYAYGYTDQTDMLKNSCRIYVVLKSVIFSHLPRPHLELYSRPVAMDGVFEISAVVRRRV